MENNYVISQREWLMLRLSLETLKTVAADIDYGSELIDEYYAALNTLSDFIDNHTFRF